MAVAEVVACRTDLTFGCPRRSPTASPGADPGDAMEVAVEPGPGPTAAAGPACEFEADMAAAGCWHEAGPLRISMLPEELLLIVFELMAPEQLRRAVQVCRRWQSIVAHVYETRIVLEPRRHFVLRSPRLMQRRHAAARDAHRLHIATVFGKITLEDERFNFVDHRLGDLARVIQGRLHCDLEHLMFVFNGRVVSLFNALQASPTETEALSVYKMRAGDMIYALLPSVPKWVWPLGPPARHRHSILHNMMTGFASMPLDRYDEVASAVVKVLSQLPEGQQSMRLSTLEQLVDLEVFDTALGPPTSAAFLRILNARDQRRISFVDIREAPAEAEGAAPEQWVHYSA